MWLSFAISELGDLSKPLPPSCVHPVPQFPRPSNGYDDNKPCQPYLVATGRIKGENEFGRSERPLQFKDPGTSAGQPAGHSLG